MHRFIRLSALAALFIAAPSFAATTPIQLQPSSSWAVGGSGVGPACVDPPSPGESDWGTSANDGVTLGVVGTNIQCCDCIRRSARFAVPDVTIAGTHLTGTFVGQDVGTYAAASFRIILYAGTSVLGHKAYETQQRANNNCIGSGEVPATIVNSGEAFDIDLTTVNTNENTTFDAFEIEVLGYACPDGSGTTAAATAILSNMSLMTAAGNDAGSLTPVPSPEVTDPFTNGPDVDAGSATTAPASGGSAPSGGSSSGCTLASPGSTMGGASIAVASLVAAIVAVGARRRRRSHRR